MRKRQRLIMWAVRWNMKAIQWALEAVNVSALDLDPAATAAVEERISRTIAAEIANTKVFRGQAYNEDAMLAMLDTVAPLVNAGKCHLVLKGLRFGLVGPPDAVDAAEAALDRAGLTVLPPEYQPHMWMEEE